jgi:RHS repeat-associated protein
MKMFARIAAAFFGAVRLPAMRARAHSIRSTALFVLPLVLLGAPVLAEHPVSRCTSNYSTPLPPDWKLAFQAACSEVTQHTGAGVTTLACQFVAPGNSNGQICTSPPSGAYYTSACGRYGNSYQGFVSLTNLAPCQCDSGPASYGIARLTPSGQCECPAGTRWDGQACLLLPGGTCPDGSMPAGEFCGKPAPNKNQGGQNCQGNPINAGFGNKFQRETDYTASSTTLALVRSYNSLANLNPSELGHPFGWNWRSTYSRAVLARNQYRSVYRPDGRFFDYSFNSGTQSWRSDADTKSILVQLPNSAGWRYTNTDRDEVEIYSDNGKLQSITTRSGVVQTLAYSDGTSGANGGYVLDSSGNPTSTVLPAGLLIRVTDSFGQVLSFGYSALNHVVKVTDPAAGVYRYAYDGVGNLSSVTYPDSKVRTYLYNEQVNTANTNLPSALTGIVAEDSFRFATYKYDASGRAVSTEHAGGAEKVSVAYTLDGGGNIISSVVTDALNTARTYSFSSVVGVVKSTAVSQPCVSGCGSAAATSYDANGNANSRTDFNGNVTTYAHDLARNLETSRTEASGTARARTITTAWHSTYRLPTQIDEPGHRTTYTHDASGNVLTKTELDTTTSTSRTWTYTYNSFGQVLTSDGPRTDVSDITTYTYYACTTGYQCGQIATITNAAGHVTTYNTYNAHGQPLTITDPNGVVTTLTYDARQRLTSRSVGSELTSFTYWPTGLLKKATLPDGSYLEYTYDAAHRLTGINDSEGNHIAYTLDAMGNRTAEQMFDPSNVLTQTRTRVFNTLNRLWKEIGAAGTANVTTEYGYDNNGNQTSVDAPLNRDAGQSYDELNRLTQVTDPLAGTTQYGYNALDQLISVTDPRSKVTSYTYNALGDLTQQVSPDTGTTINTYDSGGNLATSKDARNKTATYTYDALNRATQVAYGDQTITYGYDTGTNGKGRLISTSDSGHSLSFTYDPQGHVTAKAQVSGAVTRTASYGYTNGQLTSVTTPSGQMIAYGYTNNRITSVAVNGTTVLSNVLYEPFGPPRQWTWGNGTLAVRTFDQDGNVTQIDSAGLKTYAHDDAFRITGITDALDSTLSWSYGYDLLDRLTSATKTGSTFGYTYDANGNRLTQSGTTASTYTIAATSNRLSSVSGSLTKTYTYDAAGNVLTDGVNTLAYNNRGRMKSLNNGTIATNYTYNALGQLIKKSNANITQLYYYDEAGHLLGEYFVSSSMIQETIWLGDIPIATLRPKTGGVDVFYVHTDHLNTPRKITRPSDNKLRWRWDPDAFGNGVPNENPQALGAFKYSLRYPGQVYMEESGLQYNYLRDGYDAAVGRYTQSDPIGLRGGLNTYLYALANPASLMDPTGLTTLIYDVEKGTLIVDPEVPGRKPYETEGTSGRGECENKTICEKMIDKGPIPRGKYEVYPSRIDNPSLMDDLRRNFSTSRSQGGGDWDDWRVRIYPLPGTKRFGRTGFYLHGGYWDGSAGCIDIGGGIFGSDKLLEDLRRDPDNKIPLLVR